MSIARFSKAKISAITAVVPPKIVKLDDEMELFQNNLSQINRLKAAIGVSERRLVDDKTTASDLTEAAAENLFSYLKLDRKKIDGLVSVTTCPDYLQPGNANVLHGKLNLEESCMAFEVNHACSGYVYGLLLSYSLIECGCCSNVLFLAGDTPSRVCHVKDRSTRPLFGDAGTATLIQASPTPNPSFFSANSRGGGHNFLYIPAGGARTPLNEKTKEEIVGPDGSVRTLEHMYMNGPEIFDFSVTVAPKAITEILDIAGSSKDNVDYYFLHQANKFIINDIAAQLNVPLEKVPCDTFRKFGNQVSASIPITIIDSLKDDISHNKKNVVLCGFGSGLSWATCYLSLQNVICPEIFTFKQREK